MKNAAAAAASEDSALSGAGACRKIFQPVQSEMPTLAKCFFSSLFFHSFPRSPCGDFLQRWAEEVDLYPRRGVLSGSLPEDLVGNGLWNFRFLDFLFFLSNKEVKVDSVSFEADSLSLQRFDICPPQDISQLYRWMED